MDPGRVALRAAVAYLVLLAILRVSGKRSLAQCTPFDLVLSLVLGDLVDDLLWAEVSGARFLVAVVVLGVVHVLVGVAVHASDRVAGWVDGEPTLLLQDGRPVAAGLRRERVSETELEELLRVQGVDRDGWGDIREARLEVSGVVSVLLRPEAGPLVHRERGRLRRRRRA
jgi:uncharacterized membrane protein YcaP (DUF421 family)